MEPSQEKPLVNITDWQVRPAMDGLDPCWILIGIPSNHPNHIPGQQVSSTKPILTSRIINIDYEELIVETLNTKYKLNGPPLYDPYLGGDVKNVQDFAG